MTELSLLADRVAGLKDKPVLCVGDAMLDRFIYGSVERISPEAPIPVLRIEREAAMLGGAGNVVRNLVALGAVPTFVAVVGDDDPGREIGRLLGEHAGIDPCLVVEAKRQTTIKTRFFASSQQLLRSDRETSDKLADASRTQVLNRAKDLIAGSGCVVLSDYGKGVLTPPVPAELIAAARAGGKPVVVDPKGNDYSRYRGATVLTPNRKELHEATGMCVDGDDAIVAACRHLIATCGIEAVLATRSQDGMTLVTATGEVHHLAAEAREVFDVSGAGDTVVATLAAALASGASLLDGARLANVAAGIVVAKPGTAVVRPQELSHALGAGLGDGVVTREDAAARVADWRPASWWPRWAPPSPMPRKWWRPCITMTCCWARPRSWAGTAPPTRSRCGAARANVSASPMAVSTFCIPAIFRC